MPDVYAIITTYNGRKWYYKCFTSLINSSLQLKIVAIDNASSDDTVQYIKNKFPGIKLIESDKNLGFGQANNLGIKYSLEQGADFVFLLNQDAHINPETIEMLVKTHKKHPEYGILSPIHLNGAGDKLDKGFLNYAGPEYTEKLLNDFCLNQVSDVYESRFVNAAAWLISRECLQKVGGFDPIFFHYGEDNNYCQRVIYHGLKIGIVPSLNIFHDREYKAKKYDSKQILQYYLLTVANIGNPNFMNDHKKLCRQDYIRMTKELLHGNFNKFRINYQNLRTKKKLLPKILESRRLNMAEGPAYLS